LGDLFIYLKIGRFIYKLFIYRSRDLFLTIARFVHLDLKFNSFRY